MFQADFLFVPTPCGCESLHREFHISKKSRDTYGLKSEFISLKGKFFFANLSVAKKLAKKLKEYKEEFKKKFKYQETPRAEDLYIMGLLDEVNHLIINLYQKEQGKALLPDLYKALCTSLGKNRVDSTIKNFLEHFPSTDLYLGNSTIDRFLKTKLEGELGRDVVLEEMLQLWLENKNPAFLKLGREFIDDKKLAESSAYEAVIQGIDHFFKEKPSFGPENQDLIAMLSTPSKLYPNSLEKQLEYIRDQWGYLLGEFFLRILRGLDYLKEANRFGMLDGFTPGESHVMDYRNLPDYERFSPDRDWMPRVVLIAKSTLVWLDQLSRTYERSIVTLADIPDEELDILASRGINGLWLIGLWQRSGASQTIKNWCGNPDAAASAYSLFDYEIADEIGGWSALENLRNRCSQRGIRLASDMVPNHTGIDSSWVHNHPDWFIQSDHPPFPSYEFDTGNLSSNPGLGIYLEKHYYSQDDASVVFLRKDFATNEHRYIYHGNDGTHMPWNDTAQLNYLNPEVREGVIQKILHVAHNFPIIRFDAAMTLAKKHFQRLWFPEPGHGGDIASRSERGLSHQEFNKAFPEEFWREVVDRVGQELPDTLLLAEAFWMMESYFVRTLGMHRVYNSAFMNMLKSEENAKYRETIKNTIQFDKDILKRFVNFMNNPDEETAEAQFGTGDKYFGVCILMVTMPGLPMFGHGQIEGFTEKYGMEYKKAYKDEQVNQGLVDRHEREIFPLVRKRYLFAGVKNFYLFDFHTDHGINENVFAYSNATDLERSFIVYNNVMGETSGWCNQSAGFVEKQDSGKKAFFQIKLAEALRLRNENNAFTLFRELKSNLWYIRRSRDIYEKGMFFHLNGYESQVFLDIHEVFDNEHHHFSQLHDTLEGAGVVNVDYAMREMILSPVYNATKTLIAELENLLLKENKLSGIKEDAHKKKVRILLKEFVEPVRSFINTEFDPEKIASIFVDALNAVVNMGESKTDFLDYFDDRNKLLFLIIWILRDYDDDWYLASYLQQNLGLNGNFQLYGSWINGFDDCFEDPGEPKLSDLELCIYDNSACELLGVNYFNGVNWLKKEGLMEFSALTALLHYLAVTKRTKSLEKKLNNRFLDWNELGEKHGFNLDDIIVTLKMGSASPKKSSPKKPSTKAAKKA